MTGLLLMGVTSLVESSVVGATTATLAALVKRRLTWKVIEETVRKPLSASCMFMWVILAALSFGAVFDGLGAVHAIEFLFLDRWGLSPWGVLIMMQLSYIIMGMFLDDTAMLVIVAPLYVPLIIALGFNPVWYGVLYTITCQIAYMTPPFDYNMFLMRAMAPKGGRQAVEAGVAIEGVLGGRLDPLPVGRHPLLVAGVEAQAGAEGLPGLGRNLCQVHPRLPQQPAARIRGRRFGFIFCSLSSHRYRRTETPGRCARTVQR